MKHLTIIIIVLTGATFSFSQIGGMRSFEFLNVPNNALVSGLGGVNTSLYNKDPDLIFSSPALMHADISGILSMNYTAYISNISLASLSYIHDFTQYGLWGFALNYMDLGSIEGFDPSGNAIGDFNSRNYMIQISHARKVRVFTFGGSLKIANENLAGFRSTAITFDIGGAFVHPDADFTTGLVIKNLGFVLNDFTSTSDSKIPFDVQLGVSYKPQYMPVRFSITGYNLYEGNLASFNPDTNGNKGDKAGGADKFFRHVVLGTELIVKPNFQLRFGYNHLRRKELRLEERSGGAGFTFGLMFKVRSFEFAYSRANYHVAGDANHFTLKYNLKTLYRKVEPNEQQL